MNLSRFDLNLLVVFDALIQERSVTKVGARIGLSQPAVSHALNKLRHLLKDELFERGDGGMRPTPRALALAGPVRQMLSQLQSALVPQVFEPATATDAFNVAIYNYASTMIMAPLAQRLRSAAPSVTLHMHTNDDLGFFDQLETGALDLVIGPVRELPPGFLTEELLVDTYCGLAREDHPLFDAPLTPQVLRSLPCVGIGPRRAAASAVGEALGRKGVELQTVMTVQHLFAASAVLRHTDLVTFVLRRVATRHADIYSGLEGLRPFELPFALEPVPCLMIWHRYLTNQPAHAWLRHQIAECFSETV
ncbi:LysR family transcriptional regulator [Mesorhizobium loti]|nr:LysR family transcriptional regulator [Mesorhizobium loti]PLP59067.1 LysR family transcriptional regulator [Mesorhizobium loti]